MKLDNADQDQELEASVRTLSALLKQGDTQCGAPDGQALEPQLAASLSEELGRRVPVAEVLDRAETAMRELVADRTSPPSR